MMLNSHDDPQAAADFLLCDLEHDLSLLGDLLVENPHVADHYRARLADAAEDIARISKINTPRRQHRGDQH